jgi:glycine betaine catabolism B
MLNFIDNFLDRITMYRLMLYFLIVLIVVAVVYSFLGILPFSPLDLISSTLFLLVVSLISNKIFSVVFEAPTNVESVYISALILALIITPAQNFQGIMFLFWAALLMTASKYILAINKKHIFNPVAIAVVLTAIGLNQSAGWWVGEAWMMPFVIVGGLLIAKKIQKEDMLFVFLITAIIVVMGFTYLRGGNIMISLNSIFLSSSLFFFMFVMLTEPLTTPPQKNMQIIYGILVGILFAPQIHLAGIYSTPEIALVIGNVFSYLVSPKQKLLLTLKDKLQVGADTIDFTFTPDQKLSFSPGQYMEWTFPHDGVDSRGNRRYFTIASSPTEEMVKLGVKFYPNGSSYKRNLVSMNQGKKIVASQLAGSFVLPKDVNKKIVFIAGGIGITPFRSMIKYLLDTKQKRNITLLYSNKIKSEIMYADIFDKVSQLGIKTVYTLTGETPVNWRGRIGRIDAKMILAEIPDWKERYFYLSGPHIMVAAFEKVLKDMGVSQNQIKIDFFPGFV